MVAAAMEWFERGRIVLRCFVGFCRPRWNDKDGSRETFVTCDDYDCEEDPTTVATTYL